MNVTFLNFEKKNKNVGYVYCNLTVYMIFIFINK